MSIPTAANAAPVRYEAESASISQGVVESNHAGFSGTGFVNYDNVAGSSVEFTVNAAQAGTATLTFRYANGTADNRAVDVSVNGSLAVDERAFPGTGAWTTWQTVTNQVSLNAGQNKIKVTGSGALGGPNLDYLDVEQSTAAALEQESETATINQGVVESNHAGFSGTGFVNYNNVSGSYVEYTITAAQAGTHSLVFRYANGTAVDRPLAISVDGGTAVNLSFPGTGAWTTWQTATVQNVVLKAGANKIRGTATTANGGPNADKLTATFTGPIDNEAPTPPKNLRSTGKSATTTSLAWDAATDNVKVVAYDIYQHGQLMKTVDGDTLAATVEGLESDTEYDWTVFAKDATPNVSPASNNVIVRTDPAPPDTVPPTDPSGLRSTGKTATSVDLAWTASSDNVKVTGYEIFVDGAFKQNADGTATTATVAGLTTGKEYAFKVRAKDAKNNLSGFSNEIKETPVAGGPKGVPNPGTVSTIASGVDIAWGVVFLPDGSALFSERETFNIYRLTEGGQKTLVGKVPNAVGTSGEGGLLGLEISPTFSTDHWLYIYHTASEGNRVVRMKYENNALSSYTILLQGIAKSRFHNGGRLRWGPVDNKLYVSVGDAQNDSRAQDKNSLNGKILRINADGTIPSDNPFGNAVWTMGHRNPQGLDFDSQGRLWQAEFGQSTMDEVNLLQKGGNYGWPACEGTSGNCGGSFIAPKKTWSTGSASPSGLTIINDYVFVATTVGSRVYRNRIDANSNLVEQTTYFQGTYGRLRTVEVDKEGDIWLTTSADKDGTANNDRVLHVDIVYQGGDPEPPTGFKLTSTAFADDALIPAKYTCAGDGSPGQDPSPPLAWGPREGAQAYAIVFADRVNNGNKLHWAIWDIPAASSSLPENLGAGFNVPGQGGAKQKAMGSGANSQKFFGPCPGGSTNPYTFTLYALNTATVPGITSSSTMAQIETAIKNASAGNTVLRGRSNAKAG